MSWQMSKRHMKRCSTSLIIREMEIKTLSWPKSLFGFFCNLLQRKLNELLGHHKARLSPMPVRIKGSTNNKCCREWENGILLYCWLECKLGQPLCKQYGGFLKQKQKKELPYYPAVPPLGVYADKTVIQKDTCTPCVHRSTIYNSQDREATCVHWQMNG